MHVHTENLYDLLGVDEDASDLEVVGAWRRAAARHHPDRGGDAAVFQRVVAARDTLCDPLTRARYDLDLQVERARAREREGAGGPNGPSVPAAPRPASGSHLPRRPSRHPAIDPRWFSVWPRPSQDEHADATDTYGGVRARLRSFLR